MKKNNKKGFTLAELLIVVAIIAVLVAIAVPVFTDQLYKSQLATDTSNVRSAYSEAVTKKMTEKDPFDDDGKIAVSMADPSQYSTASVNGTTVTITHNKKTSLSNTFTIDPDVALTIS